MAETEKQDEQGVAGDSSGESSQYWDEAVASRIDGKPAPDAPPEPVEEPAKEAPAAPAETSPLPDSESGGEESETEGEETVDGSETETDDPWAAVPEEQREEYNTLKEKVDKLEHASRSANGRIGAYTKKIDELSRKLEEKSSPAKDDKEPPGEDDPGDSIFKTPAWSKFREDFGEVATPIEDAIRASYKDLHSRVQNTAKLSQSLQAEQNQQEWARQAQLLESEWPGWKTWIDDNREEFDSFVSASPHRQKLLEPNAETLTDAEAGKDLLALFKQHLDKSGKKTEQAQESPVKPNPQPRPEMAQKRLKQLESAATIAPRSHPEAGRRSDDLPDPDDQRGVAWEYFATKAPARS